MRALAGAAVAFVLFVPAVTAAPRPALRLVSTHPVHLRGAHFRAGETVRISVHAGQESGRARVVADGHGTFSATVHMAVPGCTSVSARAVGTSGDRAVAARLRVLCAAR
jgi:hypothetical protein